MTRKTANRYQHAREIFQAGLDAVAPGSAIKGFCQLIDEILVVDGQNYDLKRFDKIFVLGAGKAGASMAKAIEEILGERISAGTITVKYDHLEKLKWIKIQEAGHPLPDRKGLAGAKDILQLAAAADEKTLVICLISGGGSALMPLPAAGISLKDKQETTRILLACGATIHEINTIRKHLSKIKGGGLARAIYPATLITLILSDVVGDDLDIIASGPGVPDPGTFSDCRAILTKYSIEDQVPAAVRSHLESGFAGTVPETPKPGQPFFEKTQTVIVGNNFKALLKAREKAAELGYNTLLLSAMIEGETRAVAADHIAIVKKIQHHEHPLKPPACLISGGETTVRIQGSGKGGRNQEFVLAVALELAGMENVAVLSAGTDGTDGPTDAAGALADTTTLDRARAVNINPKTYLDNNDSYHFFEKLGDLVKTGPTNTNVMDIRIILIAS
jgi:hydroxypyruvate reductase